MGRFGCTALGILLALLAMLALELRSRPRLDVWHQEVPDWGGGAAGSDLEGYLQAEEELFASVDDLLQPEQAHLPWLSRFAADGATSPHRQPHDWNRTTIVPPRAGSARGGALLLHGLSDSPYSVRAVAEILSARGYHCLALRLPGHGFMPGGLRQVSWGDWRAAVEIGARDVAARANGGPLVVVGYSNGAALALDYALRASLEPELPSPRALVFLSPALAVSRAAALARVQERLSRVPGLGRLAFESVLPEYDPFKYNSFAINAAEQIYLLTSDLDSRLHPADGASPALPPVLTFQSAADSTVPAEVSLPRIYGRAGPGSSLVLFDINRASGIDSLVAPEVDALVARMSTMAQRRDFELTLVSNRDASTREVVARRRSGSGAMVTTPLEVAWPAGVYSLSHVAIPFPPEDPVYGLADDLGPPFPFGRLEPRGEPGAVRLPLRLLARLRFNPFFAYVGLWIEEFLDPLD